MINANVNGRRISVALEDLQQQAREYKQSISHLKAEELLNRNTA